MNKIDITFDFTSDTPNYWDCFYAGVDRPDPDAKSPTIVFRTLLKSIFEMFNCRVWLCV